MKKILLLLLVVFLLTGCGKKKIDTSNLEEEKSAVLFFSVTRNTEKIAGYIAEITNSDLIPILPEEPYSEDDIDYHNETSRAYVEQHTEYARPGIKSKLSLKRYEKIYIGYPIWFDSAPKIIYTLLDAYNLQGKEIVLFCTSGSSDILNSVNEIKEYNKKLNIISARRFGNDSNKEELINWLSSIK